VTFAGLPEADPSSARYRCSGRCHIDPSPWRLQLYRRGGPLRAAVRVLRPGVDGGSSGSDGLPGAAAGPGRRAGGRARADRGGVLRHRAEPHAGLGAPPAGRRADRSAGRSRARLGRHRDRRIRASLLRRPVHRHGAVVRALRHPAVDPRTRRPGRLPGRGSRADDAGPRAPVQARDHPDPDPGPHRDGGPGPRTGPLPGRPATVWVPARRCRAAPEQGPRRLGPARAPAGTRPAHRAHSQVDVRPAAGRAQHGPGSPAR
jgi:hypothetical protein